jgi:type I pantothenate kinase
MADSAYLELDRDRWRALRAATPLTLTADELHELRGVNEEVELEEVADIFLPLSRLLNLRVAASRELTAVSGAFLGELVPAVPFVIGVAGSVAVGKSTFARVLRALLSRWPDHPRVELLTTDGFLFPNAELEARGIMMRKGFPESYDVGRLVEILAALKSGAAVVRAPVYSHVEYDVVPGGEQLIEQADIVILEGLNVLQVPPTRPDQVGDDPHPLVSDFFDFSIYLDADEDDVRSWYVERFLALRSTAFTDEKSFFRHFAGLSEDDARVVAAGIWDTINGPNLRDNILPTRGRADLIVEKARDHRVRRVRLRRL